jgi:hypothetical protein
VEYGALRVIEILLENGAKVNSMDDMYLTPLSWLIQAGTGRSRTATQVVQIPDSILTRVIFVQNSVSEGGLSNSGKYNYRNFDDLPETIIFT